MQNSVTIYSSSASLHHLNVDVPRHSCLNTILNNLNLSIFFTKVKRMEAFRRSCDASFTHHWRRMTYIVTVRCKTINQSINSDRLSWYRLGSYSAKSSIYIICVICGYLQIYINKKGECSD